MHELINNSTHCLVLKQTIQFCKAKCSNIGIGRETLWPLNKIESHINKWLSLKAKSLNRGLYTWIRSFRNR